MSNVIYNEDQMIINDLGHQVNKLIETNVKKKINVHFRSGTPILFTIKLLKFLTT